MLKIILLVLLAIVVVVLVIAALRPPTFRTERSATITAPADALFPWINDFHRWKEWSPYEVLDPAMQRRFSGSPSGVGAVYEWTGNNKAGEGRMTMVESVSPSLVRIQIVFTKPFQASSLVEFTLMPVGDATRVTWVMSGSHPFMFRVVGVLMNLDKMTGTAFETGLANLARVVAS